MESKKIENPNESNIKANELKIELYPENNPIGEMEKYLFSSRTSCTIPEIFVSLKAEN